MDQYIIFFNPSLYLTSTAVQQIQISIMTQNCTDETVGSATFFKNKMLFVEGVHGIVGSATIF